MAAQISNCEMVKAKPKQKKMSQENVKQQIENVMNIIREQNGKCAVTGFPMSFKCAATGIAMTIDNCHEFTGSSERIDNTKGYVNDNVKFTI